jgi:hypothetical protein
MQQKKWFVVMVFNKQMALVIQTVKDTFAGIEMYTLNCFGFPITSAQISNKLILLLVFIAYIASFIGCIDKSSSYLSSSPPKEQLTGMWVIDQNRTHWRDVKTYLESKSFDAQKSYLRIGQDGHFIINDLPDFSRSMLHKDGFIISASGEWWIDFDGMNGWSYLWLEYKKVNEKNVEHRNAAANFLLEGETYFLYITIGDPDELDFLVLRKG